jgi:hypothetical protein
MAPMPQSNIGYFNPELRHFNMDNPDLKQVELGVNYEYKVRRIN